MQRFRFPFMISTLALAVSVASCGGGGGGGSADSGASQGQLQLAITDAPGDFLQYDVAVTSISLTSADGSEVQTVPLSARIDFTQYTDLTELFNVLTVPVGTYKEVSLNLDYSDASVVVEGEDGAEIQPRLVDEDGEQVEDVSLRLKLPDNESLVVKPGSVAQLSIDFDLAASHEVDLVEEEVVVGPVMFARTMLDETREHRVRGLLDGVDVSGASFVVDLLPLYLRRGNEAFGESEVNIDADTVWLIDDVRYIGREGLEELAELGQDAPVVVLGSIDDGEVLANHVYAGTSVPWVGREAVQGVVIARNDETLTVRGRAIEVGDNEIEFSHFRNVTVALSDLTEVSRQLYHEDALDAGDIGVGQRVTVFGDLEVTSRTSAEMDASNGHVHMELNQVEGTVSDRSPFELQLEEINGRSPAIFDFEGSGISAFDDVDVDAFEIDNGALDLSSIDTGDYIRVRGFFNAWGQAPADFVAESVIDPNQEFGDTLLAYWNPSTNTVPVLAISNDLVELNTDESEHGVLYVEVTDDGVVADAPLSLALVPDQDGMGSFAVKSFSDREINTFSYFETFEALMDARVDEGQKLVAIEATGKFNELTGQFEVSNAVAVFKENQGKGPDWDDDDHPGKHKGRGRGHDNGFGNGHHH